MSTYGDLLSAFPELMKKYQFFTMEPRPGGGYFNRQNLFVKEGSFLRGAKSYAAVQGEARAVNEVGVFYCHEIKVSEVVQQGIYFEDSNQMFLINDDQFFGREAGFGAYGCQLVQGPTDKQVENLNVESRTIGDYQL